MSAWRTLGSSTSSLPESLTSLTLYASMKVRNEKNESLESTPIGKPVPKARVPVFWR